MGKIVGIRFKSGCKIYDFDCGAFVLHIGDSVIVETEKGLAMGLVARLPANQEAVEQQDQSQMEDIAGAKNLKKVFRKATGNDFAQVCKNEAFEQQAHAYCQACIKELGLQMSLFSVESTYDSSQLTFFFTADGRVDFRQLVKMLVKELKVRIEMRQVGIRNQAKMCGGLSRCGRELCCSSFIEKFDPVSIRMAKDQGLSLNPTKISGQCGRLMCCLTFENDVYQELKAKFPGLGKIVKTKDRSGKVVRVNLLRQRVALLTDEDQEIEVGLEEIIP